MWATDEYIVPPARKGRFLPPYKTLTALARVCMCVRSSLNTNKVPLTYCQLSEVNLSRINFRCKRLRPENPLVSNYLRIDRAMRRWRDEYRSISISLSHFLCLSLYFCFSLSVYTLHTQSFYLIPSWSTSTLSSNSIFPKTTLCTHVHVHLPSL